MSLELLSAAPVAAKLRSLKRSWRIALGLLTLLPVCAVAQETGLWRSSGDWQVRVDSSLGYGCFMAASYRNGEVVRLGFNNATDTSYLLLGNVGWPSLSKGRYYTVSLQFDGAAPIRWAGVVTDGGFLSFRFSDDRLWQTFADSRLLTIWYQGNMVTRLPLTGTYAATQVVRECNREFARPFGPAPRPHPFGS